MTRFKGQIEDVLQLRSKEGLGLFLSHIEGMPEIGMPINVGGEIRRILKLGRNTTDGKHVSDRDCLTGQPCAPYGHILVDWAGEFSEAQKLRLQWITEEIEQ